MSENTSGNNAKIAKDISPVNIKHEMENSYLDYAMSVIISRALPDIRDGLKPVHRRILYAMKTNGIMYNKAFVKSARVVGEVLGKYHPHGDAAVYDAMVRMAQDFSMGLTLVDKQGNFGSIDGDKPASQRYTEVRLHKTSTALLDDLDKNTVDWRLNYDETLQEPIFLPAKFPNLLVNGGGGIAVGMATNIPTHNLGEVLNACIEYIDNPDITTEELISLIPGPDFPTGGTIVGRSGILSAYSTGRGSVIMRGKAHFEEKGDRSSIIITEIPYQVNKTTMIEKMVSLVKEKKIEGISDIRDESDKDGIRIVIELKKGIQEDVILNQLYSYTPLQSSFGVNMLAIMPSGKPELLTLKEILKEFIHFREDTIRRRTIYDLNKARDKAHLLIGLSIAVENLDEIIILIRNSKDPNEAKEKLMLGEWDANEVAPLIKLVEDPKNVVVEGKCKLTEEQAKGILDLRLHRLTGLERERLHGDLRDLSEEIKAYLKILTSRERLYELMRNEFIEVRNEFAAPRKTEIIDAELDTDIEDLIPREDMIVTVTNTGYIKRVPLSTYRAQRRGGKGRSAMSTKEEDFVTTIFSSNTHTPIVFFTNKGMAYKLKVYKLPLGSPQSLGKALINLLPLDQGENVTAIMPLPEDEDTWEELHVMFATSKGTVRRNKLSDFTGIRANGKIAMKLNEGDYLVDVKVCNENQDVFLALKNGKCIRFKVTDIRVFTGRNSVGVRGIKVSGDDKVISMSILDHVEVDTDTRYAYLKKSKALRRIEGEEELEGENTADEDVKDIEIDDATFEMMQEKEEFILTVTESGFGKRTSAYEYRVTGRGGSGLANIKIAGRNKHVVASFPVEEEHDLILVTDQGKLIRMPIETIRIAGRQTMGVTLFRVNNNEKVVSAVAVEKEEDEPENEAEQDNQGNTDLQSDQTPQKENMVTEEKTQVVEETNKEKPDGEKQETEDASDDQNNDSEEDDGNMNLF